MSTMTDVKQMPRVSVWHSIRRKLTFNVIMKYILVALCVLFTALPLIYVFSTAFKPLAELMVFPPQFFVRNPTLDNFSDLLVSFNSSSVPFTRYIFNSVFTAAVTVVCTVFISSMAAYGMVKLRPRGRNAIFLVILGALMFSTHVTQIPTYMVIEGMDLLNNYLALILPKIAVAYNFFLMKQFTEQIPDELLESARMDGAGEWTAFTRIVIPLLRPAWATLVVFTFTSNWNDYFSPLIFTTDEQMKTLPLALQTISGGVGSAALSRAGAAGAASLLMILPTIVIFMFMQSKVMETMAYSGIKG